MQTSSLIAIVLAVSFLSLGMPGMTMTFPVADQSLLDGLKVGAQIRFGIRERDEGMVVEQIKVLEGQP